jgi:glycosyltransferase involved in cell wall biosynthesis
MIENTYQADPVSIGHDQIANLREALGLVGRTLIVYTGTLEAYQGIDLLLEAAPLVADSVPESHFLIVGGSTEQSDRLGRVVAELGLDQLVTCIPSVEPDDVPRYHHLAAALVTCRTRGVNTPLKIYEYLRSGRPIVATAIESHTQVLDHNLAELVAPTPSAVASGLIRLLTNPTRASDVATSAAKHAEERYGSQRYLDSLNELLSHIDESRVGVQPGPEGEVRAFRAIEARAHASASGVAEPTAPNSVRR